LKKLFYNSVKSELGKKEKNHLEHLTHLKYY